MKQKNRIRKTGTTQRDGIRFYSDIHPSLAVITTNVEGSNKYFIEVVNYYNGSRFSKSLKYKAILELIIYALPILFTIVLIARSNYSVVVKLCGIYCSSFLIFNVEIILLGWIDITFVGGIRERRFHGAEHKAINALDNYGKDFTVEDVKNESKYSDRCGSRMPVLKTIVFLLDLLFAFKIGIHIPPIILILLTIAIEAIAKNVIWYLKIDMLLQWLFVSEPTKSEIMVAYFGLKQLIKEEDKYKEKFS